MDSEDRKRDRHSHNDFLFWPKTEWLELSSPFIPGHPISIILFFFSHQKEDLIWDIICLAE